jgi:hypothetical protein
MHADRCYRYLLIPPGYANWLGGVRWSNAGDALEYGDGATFALCPQIALFLEGFSKIGPPPHFAHVVHLMNLIGYRRLALPTRQCILAWQFDRAGRPVRNAGALAALICRDILGPATHVDLAKVCNLLSSGPAMAQFLLSFADLGMEPVETPALEPNVFEAKILDRVAQIPTDELSHWLHHGCASVEEPAAQLAKEIPLATPKSLGQVVEELLERRRLAGAVPFVAQLVSALALPPRRLAHQELPLGGYADVHTHGHVEHILPSQFALDDIEFVRRFAENELLFFRREEPASKVREELVVLLDQGVRTWGTVRLVLTAAVVALIRRAERGHIPFQFACTSHTDGIVDPTGIDESLFASLLEASDLSPHPGLALERVLDLPTDVARDIVLLSHPRSLREEDIVAVSRRVQPPTRLFTLTVNVRGDASLDQMSRGTPIKVRTFHVDMNQAVEIPATTTQALPPTNWTGDIEPIGFPFHIGICLNTARFLFDLSLSGEWLLVASSGDGLLCAYTVANGHCEMLPRTCINGKVVTEFEKVIGVADGFVVIGRDDHTCWVLHYDFHRRRCTAHPLPLGQEHSSSWRYHYLSHWHAIVVRRHDGALAIDLTTGGWFPPPPATSRTERLSVCQESRQVHQSSWTLDSREYQAFRDAEKYVVPPPHLLVVTEDGARAPEPCLRHHRSTGQLEVLGWGWKPFIPQSDGMPALTQSNLLDAQLGGDVLAVLSDGQPTCCLRLFRGPDGFALPECVIPSWANFALSRDGRRLARQFGKVRVEVRDTETGTTLMRTARHFGCPRLAFTLGIGELHVRSAHWEQWINWKVGSLIRHARHLRQAGPRFPISGIVATEAGRPSWVRYDPRRFTIGAEQGGLVVVADVFGNLIVFDRLGTLLCIFRVHEGATAAWLPDGTIFDSRPNSSLSTPGASAKIAAALCGESRAHGKALGDIAGAVRTIATQGKGGTT